MVIAMTMQGGEMRALRKAAGMTQQQLADYLGMTATSIGLMERGVAPIERRTERLMHVLPGYNVISPAAASGQWAVVQRFTAPGANALKHHCSFTTREEAEDLAKRLRLSA